jgi:hypothetical protein
MPTTLKSADGNQTIYLDPRLEYLNGGTVSSALNPEGTSVISSVKDDLMLEFGLQIYDQMENDPKVSKSLNLLKILTLANGIQFLPAVSDQNPEYDTAVKVKDFCNYACTNMKKPLKFVFKEMLDALKYGYKIGEKVYKIGKVPGFEGNMILLDRINAKPLSSASFVVDKSLNVVGITPANRYSLDSSKVSYTVGSGQHKITLEGKEYDLNDLDKFIILTLNSANNDPRGKSALRPAFNAWYLKTQIFPEYLRYLLTCAFPLLVGFTPENMDREETVRDSNGDPIRDNQGRMVKINPTAALRDALLGARNSSVVALKGGSELKEIGGQGGGLAFYKAIEVFDSQIEQAIVLQTLATSESRFNTRAASQTHMSVLDTLVWDLKDTIGQCITDYILKDLIRLNLGEDYLRFMPKVSLGDTERRDFALDAQAVAALYASGFISEDQKRFLDEMLGIPARDVNYDQFKHISPNEALQLSQAVLQQSKLESEIIKAKQDANKLRVDQIKSLQELAVGGSLSSENQAKMSSLISSILDDIAANNLFEEQNKILQGLTDASARVKNVLIPDELRQGDENRTSPTEIIDTNRPVETPSSEGSSGRPYIKSKAKSTVNLNVLSLEKVKNLINFIRG